MTDLFEPLPDTPVVRRRENTRSRLVRASLDVFVDKGIDGATIDDLVKAAGFTRGAFYSSFTRKEEVFAELFKVVTDEVIDIVRASVERAVSYQGGSVEHRTPADDAEMMVGVFEAIRPYGRQWYLLYSEATAHALRTPEGIESLNRQRHRLREAIAEALSGGMRKRAATSVIDIELLAQLLIGIFVDFMVQENLDGVDVTEQAAATILRVHRSFLQPVGDTTTCSEDS